MKIRRNIFALLIVIILLATIYLPIPQKVYALTNDCVDMSGMMVPCPDTGGGRNKPGPKNHPTAAISRPTSTSASTPTSTSTSTPTSTATATPTATPTQTSTSVAIPITGGGAGSNNTDSNLPAMQNPGQGSSPLPGPLGMIIAVLIIVVCIIGGLGVLRFFRKAGENPASFGNSSIISDDPSSQFDKSSDQFEKMNDPSLQFEKGHYATQSGSGGHTGGGSGTPHISEPP